MTVIINLYFLIIRLNPLLYNKGYDFIKEMKNFG